MFEVGQFVDISGTSIGKGFQGGMKRWGFGGQPASHGASKSHRLPGSIGQRKTPGRVFKGKKMAGHMGCKRITVHSLCVREVHDELNVILVDGCVPGHKGSVVEVRDALRVKKSAMDLWREWKERQGK